MATANCSWVDSAKSHHHVCRKFIYDLSQPRLCCILFSLLPFQVGNPTCTVSDSYDSNTRRTKRPLFCTLLQCHIFVMHPFIVRLVINVSNHRHILHDDVDCKPINRRQQSATPLKIGMTMFFTYCALYYSAL